MTEKLLFFIGCILFGILDFIAVLFVLSLFASLFNSVTASQPCKTRGYYLPATYVMCNINRER
jgi:hypothetical protein